MPELPTCDCISGYPPYDRLTFIYQAAAELSEDDTLPSADCVAGVPPFDRFAYIYAAFRVLAGDDSLPSQECVEGEPFQDQVTRIYQAALAYAGDAELPGVECVRGTPIWQQWVNIYAALYSAAGSPDELTNPFCLSPQFDILSNVFCALLVQSIGPELLSAEISIDGTQITLVFNEPMDGEFGFSVLLNGVPSTPSYNSGNGTTTFVFDLDTIAQEGDVATLNYSTDPPSFGDFENLEGDPLESFSDFPVTNNTGGSTFLRPGGVDTYFRPDGTSIYLRP